MTEAEWLASADPVAMGEAVVKRKRASARVLRLYTAAFWAWQSHRLKAAADRDRLAGRAALVAAWAETGAAPPEATDYSHFVGFATNAQTGFLSTVRAPGGWKKGKPAVAHAVLLLREVFGNPFATRRRRKADPRRGWMFDAGWRTDTVLTLASQMYAADEFSAMAILADALQDAGCDNDDILTHCRAPGGGSGEPAGGSPVQTTHVGGCWVLDLVLGKG